WNGKKWLATSGAPPTFAMDAISDTSVWAAGPDGIAHWNGSKWASVPVASPGSSMSFEAIFAASSNDIWAGGQYLDGSTSQTLFEHWDGSAWTQVPAPSVGVVSGITGLSASDVWAVAGDAAHHPDAG